MTGAAAITLDLQLKCVAREIAMRKNVYRRRVSQGAMKQEEADRELTSMEAVYESLKLLQRPDAGLQGTLPLLLYFGSEADRDEFMEMMKEAKPNMVAKKL
jgi:hypothetical protein